MKSYSTFLFFNILYFSCFGQEVENIEFARDSFQRENFEKALINLDTGNNRIALTYFHVTHRIDSTSEMGEN
ncbi:MAG: hypothetical protein ACI85I_000160 [Arenicella sp.]|jgi:hypothetical protein